MTGILQQAVAPNNLNLTWRRLRKDNTRWDLDTERLALERDLLKYVGELVQDLQNGTYRPGNLRQFTIAKIDGSRRVLSALYLRDKFAQRAVLQVIEPIGETMFDDDSYGYRPKRGVDKAITRARERIDCGLGWLLDADLTKFFDTIPHKLLLKRLSQVIRDRDVIRLMGEWLTQGTMANGWLKGRCGIAQGAVLSPFQCNVYLHTLDSYWRQKGIAFVRYADDFLLFAPTKKDIQIAAAMTEGQLTKLGISLNQQKTRIVEAGPSVEVLGERLNRKHTASKGYKAHNKGTK